MYNKQFHELAVGNVFRMNGNIYVKQSSRTAWLAFDVHSVYFCGEFIASEQTQLEAINKAIAYNEERMKAHN